MAAPWKAPSGFSGRLGTRSSSADVYTDDSISLLPLREGLTHQGCWWPRSGDSGRAGAADDCLGGGTVRAIAIRTVATNDQVSTCCTQHPTSLPELSADGDTFSQLGDKGTQVPEPSAASFKPTQPAGARAGVPAQLWVTFPSARVSRTGC